jgi:hypothetical protein
MTAKKKRPLCVISGVGRSGTTFLVELLTELGLDTGFTDESKRKANFDEGAKAGLEINPLFDSDPPYIVKDPRFCDYIDTVMESGRFDIENVIVPIRRLELAAVSRIVQSHAKSKSGALVKTRHAHLQINLLAETFYHLMDRIAFHDLSFTVMSFPKLATDADYTYRKLGRLVASIDFDQFQAVFRQVSKPERVHQFTEDQIRQYLRHPSPFRKLIMYVENMLRRKSPKAK